MFRPMLMLAGCAVAASLSLVPAQAFSPAAPTVAQAPLLQPVQDDFQSGYGSRQPYHVNRYGFGHYTHGPDGSYGPYPAGSAGAQIYKQQHRWVCDFSPSRC